MSQPESDAANPSKPSKELAVRNTSGEVAPVTPAGHSSSSKASSPKTPGLFDVVGALPWRRIGVNAGLAAASVAAAGVVGVAVQKVEDNAPAALTDTRQFVEGEMQLAGRVASDVIRTADAHPGAGSVIEGVGIGGGVALAGAAAWRAAGRVGGSRRRSQVLAGGSKDPAHVPDFRGVELPPGVAGTITHTAFADGTQQRVVQVYPASPMSPQAGQFPDGRFPFEDGPVGPPPRSAADAGLDL
jgi:hypothetical protein